MEFFLFTCHVGLAFLLGAGIGVERQFRQHPAGLRTNALVSVGAALFVSLSGLMEDTNSPTRIASYIVSGIGFLGGGVILKEGVNVRGMNTAATLWCTAAIGTLCGTGFPAHAIVGTAAILSALTILRPVAHWVDKRQKRIAAGDTYYQLRAVCSDKQHLQIRTIIMRHVNSLPGFTVTGIATRRRKSGKQIVIADLTAEPANDKAVQEIVNRLTIEPCVRSASWLRLPRPGE